MDLSSSDARRRSDVLRKPCASWVPHLRERPIKLHCKESQGSCYASSSMRTVLRPPKTFAQDPQYRSRRDNWSSPLFTDTQKGRNRLDRNLLVCCTRPTVKGGHPLFHRIPWMTNSITSNLGRADYDCCWRNKGGRHVHSHPRILSTPIAVTCYPRCSAYLQFSIPYCYKWPPNSSQYLRFT